MKKNFILRIDILKTTILLLSFILLITPLHTFASDDIKVIMNGEYVEFDIKPQMVNDRVLVPLRSVFENIGGTVEWNEYPSYDIIDGQFVTSTRQCVYVTACGHHIALDIDSTTATVDYRKIELDVPATLISDRTYIPLRFISENIGGVVGWDESTNTVTIDTPAPDYTEKYYVDFPEVPSFKQICGWNHIVEQSGLQYGFSNYIYFIGDNNLKYYMLDKYIEILNQSGFKEFSFNPDVPLTSLYYTNGNVMIGIDYVSPTYIAISFFDKDGNPITAK